MIDYSLIFAGLGMFLFGMKVLEDALKIAAGSKLKILLKKYTDGVTRSILTGTISTAIFQSSSLVSLMVLAFVGAGFVEFYNAIGVIIGSNIGTTFTSWIVAFFGFKVKISAFAMPMIAIGGFGVVLLSRSKKQESIFRMIVGFGLLFLGLDFMKESMEAVSSNFDLNQYKDYNFLVFVLIGILLTAAIQSSSAVVAVVLSALHGGLIDFEIAALMVIGSNIGTTITMQLGAIGGTADKKRLSLAHFIFNFVTGIVALLLLKPLGYLILEILDMKQSPILAIAMFHTIFNVLGLLLFVGFIPKFTFLLSKLFRGKRKKLTRYIDDVDPSLTGASTLALHNEVERFFEKSIKFILLMLNVSPNEILSKNTNVSEVVHGSTKVIDIDIQEFDTRLKKIETLIIVYTGKIKNLSDEDQKSITSSINTLKKCIFAIKAIKDVKHNIDEFSISSNGYTIDKYNNLRIRITKLTRAIVDFKENPSSSKMKSIIEKSLLEIQEDDENTINIIAQSISLGELSDIEAPGFISLNRAVFNASDALSKAILFLVENMNEQKQDLDDE